MAKIRSGVLGNTRGKVAGVVGSQWKNVNYLREYVKPANPNTAAQQAQRAKITGAVSFCKPLVGPVFNAYTDRFQKGMSGFNRFIKTNIDQFGGVPGFSAIKLTEGKLFPIDVVSSVYTTGTPDLVISWAGALGNNGADDDDVYAAVQDSSTELWYWPAAEVSRDTDSIAIVIPAGLNAANLESYVWAIQQQTGVVTLISDSVWYDVSIP